ncbi:MAG: DUF1028 domain-containing protein [Hyphomicrobiales bacterium]
MTFSIAGRCARTGMFGVAIATSSICVGARCPHARAHVGAVASQNVTDPDLARLVLDEMERGHSAHDAIARVVEGRPNINYRQLTAVDRTGTVASWTGTHILGTNGVSEGEDCIAAGNLLATAAVPIAMTDAFAAAEDLHLAERLLRSLEAGLAAGGEAGLVHSSALLVYGEHRFPLVDLRCDWDDDDPIGRLRALWTAYEPQMEAYLTRALDPSAAPSYGVKGDL